MTTSRLTLVAVASVAVAGALNLSPWSLSAATAATAPRDASVPSGTLDAGPGLVADSSERQAVAVRYVVVSGSKARYRVRERLLGNDFDNDAIGETSEITGGIALDSAGAVIRNLSSFTVKLTGLKSDKSRRDRYVQTRVLETDEHPTTKLAVTEVRGLPSPLPTSGWVQFQIVGNLTVKGATRPATWDVNANVVGDKLSGTAATAFTFDDFKISQPKVSVLLSVADTIRLEYDFAMKKQAQ